MNMSSSKKPNILRLSRQTAKLIVNQARKLHDTGIRCGVENILQPGLVKEIIIASVLDHDIITNKRLPDACSRHDNSKFYEYLTCEEGGTWQIDRMFRALSKRAKSLQRISRNEKLYLALFKKNSLELVTIFEVECQPALDEANRQLDASTNDISHVSFNMKWAKAKGKIVY